MGHVTKEQSGRFATVGSKRRRVLDEALVDTQQVGRTRDYVHAKFFGDSCGEWWQDHVMGKDDEEDDEGEEEFRDIEVYARERARPARLSCAKRRTKG